MRNRHAFTLTDLLASIACVAVLLSLTASTLAGPRTTSQRMQNSTQLRGIHQGLVTFANSNKEKFPGLDSKGNILTDSDDDTGGSGHGDTSEARYWLMLTYDFITPEYAISPVDERATEYVEPWGNNEVAPVTFENYSFAMLDIAGPAGQPPDASGRYDEWQQSLNTQAIVLSDRNCTDLNAAGPFPTSIWNPDTWHGSVLWNDNHVAYEETYFMKTRYGRGDLNIRANGDGYDNLFTAENEDGTDALLTFSKDEDGNERAVPGVIEDEE
ncbi:MAG: hypothetical protein ACIAXF_15485 [Phycisphaerales bacterium JB063]